MSRSGHGVGVWRRWAFYASLVLALLIGVSQAQAQGAPGWLAAKGVRLGGSDSETLLGNLAGGIKTGATLQGLTLVTLHIDTGKAFGWRGGSFEASALQIHGRSLSPYYLGDLQTANGNEASDATRLWTLWFDQRFDRGRVDIKIGQQSVDQEFIVSKNSGLFVNTMAGWPLLPSVDLYAGGPAYPLSSLGVRLRVKPRRDVTMLLGVFDDNPPGGSFYQDPQSLDAGGVAFSTHTGALVMGELDDRVDWAGLRGAYKIGFWYDTARFPVPGIAGNGVSLASPLSAGGLAYKRHDYSVYGVVDQTVWTSPVLSARRVSVFGRVMAAPGDRNLVGFSFNGGVTLSAPLAGRDQDEAGIDVGIGQVGSAMVAYDRAIGAYSGAPYPVQGVETLIEATYQAQITGWWQVQPDVQYVINPGAGIPDPAAPGRRLANELVVGVRTVITF